MPASPTPETLTELRGDLVLAALCVGQFHAPCQLDNDRLLVRADKALIAALDALGIHMAAVVEPFTPAPVFVPHEVVLAQVAKDARRRVRTHISEIDVADDPEEASEPPASNA
ncbi:hypothetical protein AB4874_13500 [Thioclava sp. 15-R06ZXC-3]|uniref:Urease accessory protein UreE C-terminal domain-containing protein n=1 Tax=Thioclava arctica TaxID=3238301 RepID=A0ABV3TM48_9RHOB